MENFEKCTVAMLGGPCLQHVTAKSAPKCYNNMLIGKHITPAKLTVLNAQPIAKCNQLRVLFSTTAGDANRNYG